MKITIITATYNREKTLGRTIESVLNQTHNDIEYIIIDGGSNDHSVEIIKKYEKKFKEKGYLYKYISEKDTGIYNAMNKGIKMATGDIIGIIGSDDWYELDALERVNFEFEQNRKLKMTYGILRTVKDGKFNKVEGNYYSYGICQHPTVFLKKEVYSNIAMYDESYKIAADTALLLKLKKLRIEFKFIDRIITNFTEEGVSSTNFLNTKLEDTRAYFEAGEINSWTKNILIMKYWSKYFRRKMKGYLYYVFHNKV